MCLIAIMYGLFQPVAVGWLALRHYRADAPGERLRLTVAVLTLAGSVGMLAAWLTAIPAALLLVGIGVYVIAYNEVMSKPSGSRSTA